MNVILTYFAIKYDGNWDKIYNALEQKEEVSKADYKKTKEKMESQEFEVITIIDKNYPQVLKEGNFPPYVLWLKGNKRLLDKDIFTIAAEEKNNDYFKKTEDVLNMMHKNSAIAIRDEEEEDKYFKKTSKHKVIVLSEGINTIKETSNKELYISEYPIGSKRNKIKDKYSNRIVAALSQNLILVNSKRYGTINNLINNFIVLDKEIYCFPGNNDKEDGNSLLIKQGAKAIKLFQDIVSYEQKLLN